ncbi:hypothetical protein [Acaryochloris thomasi]|uniref:hypothetical protein n=1 Tax=Acaryochloris thomasi TaxID=2929456 RepID=UPI000DA6C126|nr:hypothetical protein [Acaryochloris thomasi]
MAPPAPQLWGESLNGWAISLKVDAVVEIIGNSKSLTEESAALGRPPQNWGARGASEILLGAFRDQFTHHYSSTKNHPGFFIDKQR